MPEPTLVERKDELGTIDEALSGASTGGGAAIVVEGVSGIGKSSLLRAAATRADEAGFVVLEAYGGEMEAADPWSVARQLFWPALAADAESLLADPALAGLPFGPGATADPPGDRLFGGLHALFWLVTRLSESSPLLISVDDAHLADAPSAQLLAFLARRVAGLPVLLLVASRPARDAGEGPVALIAGASDARIIEPAPLAVDGVAEILRRAGADPGLAAASREATGGTPLLVREVALALARDDEPGVPDAERVRRAASRGVARAALAQMAEVGPDAVAFARALAIADHAPSVDLIAGIAELESAVASDVADELSAAGLVVAGPPLRFSHPLVRDAVYAELPPADRAEQHRRAAMLLAARGEAAPAAAHLVEAGPGGDAAAVEILRTAASDALSSGDAATAGALLERAVAEPPEAGDRGLVLAELGRAYQRAGRPEAADAFERALAEDLSPAARAEIGVALGTVLVWVGRREEAMDVLERALAELGDDDPALLARLELEVLATTRRDVRLQARADERVARLRALAGGEGGVLPDPVQRVLLAALAFDAVLQQPAATVGDFARRALGDGQLLAEQGPESPALPLAIIALWMSEDLAGASAALDSALDAARQQGSVMGFVMLSCWRSHVAWRAGDLTLAEADGANALEVGRELGIPPAVAYATASLGDALLDRGEVDDAAALLDDPLVPPVPAGSDSDQGLLFFRGRLRAAQGRPAEALADLELCGAGLAAFGATTPVIPWRGEAALAARAAGAQGDAARLAEEGAEVARAFGAPGALGAALRAAGVVAGDGELLAEAVELLADSPCRLEHAKALADLGEAHRRAGREEQALAVLREGLDLADQCGAVALSDALRGSLVALGARPRRRRTSGPAALTPSELRVAALAAEGHTNREIAQTLFVTMRTVEMHLSNAYGKLEIPGRPGLAAALASG